MDIADGARPLSYISLFSGIEAASAAWEPLGFQPVCFSEIDPFPSAVLAERYPSVPNLGDITKVGWGTYRGACDLVVGGSPCQSFSVAGKREGLHGASGLMFEYIRAVQEVRPRWFLWENVPGALSSEHGEAFRQLLSEMGKLGYGLAWRVLDAQFFGVAQRRERVFLVGRLGDTPPAEVLFEREGVPWDFEQGRKKREALARASGRGAEVSGFKYSAGKSANTLGDAAELSPTLIADYHEPAVYSIADQAARAAVDCDLAGTLHVGGGVPMVACCEAPSDPGPAFPVRRLTPRECERLQGFPDDWTRVPYRGKPAEECPDGPRYKAVGNSMAVPVMRWIGRRIALSDAGLIY